MLCSCCRWLFLAAVLSAGLICAAVNRPTIWEYKISDFSQDSYIQAVETLVAHYEKISGKQLKPGAKGQVALKVDTLMGAGLSTPLALTRAVIAALKQRGFQEKNIILFDCDKVRLREAGYLPPISEGGQFFDSCPVMTLEDTYATDPQWFYESPMPSTIPVIYKAKNWTDMMATIEASRRSYLPVALMFDVDFWINLPVGKENPGIGVVACLANESLENATNTDRFWKSSSYACMAIAEIAAIPELQATLAFTILSLERYQYVGGLCFNSQYTYSEKKLWLSTDAVWLDYKLLEHMNFFRKKRGFEVYEAPSRLFDYATGIGLGNFREGVMIAIEKP